MKLLPISEIKGVEASAPAPEWSSIAEDLLTYIDGNYQNIFVTSNMLGMNNVCAASFPSAPFTIFNPRIVIQNEEMVLKEELSPLYPGMKIKIKRPTVVRVRFEDMMGTTHTERFEHMTARYIIQAIEVLNGSVEYYNQASAYHKELGLKKYRKRINGKS